MSNKFIELNSINVNEYVEKKNGLSYLTWSYAWAEFKKRCPDATYEVKKDENGKPYFGDENIGYMVYTSVTADGITYEMWLPVMDANNKSMKAEAYTYRTRQGERTVEAMTMFDVNKTIMRCLVKNLAMFGLGLYIYAGEDLPEGENKKPTAADINALKKLIIKLHDGDQEASREYYEANCTGAEEDVDKLAYYIKVVTSALKMKG
jgi:hypothetical protein